MDPVPVSRVSSPNVAISKNEPKIKFLKKFNQKNII